MIKMKFDTINKFFFFFLNDILNQNNKRPHRKIYSQTQSARNKKKFNIAADQLYAVSKTQYIFSDQNTNSSSNRSSETKQKNLQILNMTKTVANRLCLTILYYH